jgi:hypothetical protein
VSLDRGGLSYNESYMVQKPRNPQSEGVYTSFHCEVHVLIVVFVPRVSLFNTFISDLNFRTASAA